MQTLAIVVFVLYFCFVFTPLVLIAIRSYKLKKIYERRINDYDYTVWLN